MESASRLFDLLARQVANKPRPTMIAYKYGGPTWQTYSTAEVASIVDRLSTGLLELGLKPGDTVGLISDNRPEWNFVDLAALQLGMVVVPVFPTLTADNYAYILNHAECKIVFASGGNYLAKVQSKREDLPTVQHVFCFDETTGTQHWKQLLNTTPTPALSDFRAAVTPQHLATIIYTSGTTGVPKGVMLTHSNLLSNATTVADFVLSAMDTDIMNDPDFKAISFLPLSHVFERAVFYAYLYKYVPVFYAQSMDTLAEDIKDVKPYFFSSVPRLLEKVFDKIKAKGEELGGLKKKILFWAIDLATEFDPERPGGWFYQKKLGFARKRVFSKWKEALGGNIRMILVGAAKTPPELMRIFWGAGIPILEAYGMSETSPGISSNRMGQGGMRIGSVGKAIPGVTLKIEPEPGYPAGEGEVCAAGPNVMQGYYKNPQASAEAIDADGFMHTGDIGRIDADGFLFITDRKKEMFKTANGKYVAPSHVEAVLKSSPFLEQVMAIGEGKKFVVALMVPNFLNLEAWAKQQKLSFSNWETLVKLPEVLNLIQAELNTLNPKLDRHEQVKKFTLMPREWSVDTDELTPTLKLKRRIITQNWGAEIDKLYQD